MRHLILLLAAAALVLSSAAAQADLGDQLFKLLANDGAPGDGFGFSVAISNTTAIVGAVGNDDFGNLSGSAYLFDTATGSQIVKLLPDDGAGHDQFGKSVGLCGTTAVVGALHNDDNGFDSGSAYLFDTATGQQIAKLLPDDGAAGDNFGGSVAISGETIIVGARKDEDNGSSSGSAYLFDTTTGQQIAKLLPSDGAGGHAFGISVAISNTTAIVGAVGNDDNGLSSGSAYLFDTTSGEQIAKLLPDDGAMYDGFGAAVGISNSTAIVGAPLDDDYGTDSGSVYLFDTTSGQQIAKLLPDDSAAGDHFGESVAINGVTAIVGAHRAGDNGPNSGAAYLFNITTGQQIAKLLADDGVTGERFGISVAISGTTAIVGANWGNYTFGSAYLFDAAVASDCSEDSDGMVTICHVPPGNPNNARTISVGANAVPAHLAHGDHCGPCEEDDGSLDCNDNTIPDDCEPDCNDNDQADSCDIAKGISDDCNDNGTPDECELDCNENGQPDSCDIADGVSEDCNDNAVPDECEPAEDCNANGVQDICDVADETSADCNANGTPDECEEEPDCNGNGQLDSCDIAEGSSVDCFGDNGFPDGVPDECCPGDVLGENNDVGPFDLAFLLASWGACPDSCIEGVPTCACRADFDRNCTVNAFDLAVLLGAWGPCP